MHRRTLLLLALVVAAPRVAGAEPPMRASEDLFRPPIEWSTWIRAAGGVVAWPEALVARGTLLPTTRTAGTWEGGLGGDASLPLSVHGNLRIGGWLEQRGLAARDAFVGGELVFTAAPLRFEMFAYEGQGILALRAGRSATAETAALAWGYLAPWKLEGPCAVRFYDIPTGVCAPRPQRTTRYMVGVRLVATVTRDLTEPHAFRVTLGIETEALGALRMFLVRRSWY